MNRRPVRGRAACLAAAGGHLWPGRGQPQAARRGGRRTVRQPAGRRPGRGGTPAGERPGRHRTPHRPGRVLAGRRSRPLDAPRLRDAPSEHGPITPRIDRIDWKPDAVELGGHAHYMLKEIREQPDTVVDACRGRLRRAEATAAVRRAEPLGPPAPPGPPDRLRRLRHELARGAGGRIPDRAARPPAGRGRVCQRVPLSQRAARRPDARLRPQPVGRDRRHARRRCARPSAEGTRPWRSSTPSAAPSPARPTAGSTSTPGPRSASPAPRRSRPRSTVLTLLALYLGRLRHLSFSDGLAVVKAIESVPAPDRRDPQDRAHDR